MGWDVLNEFVKKVIVFGVVLYINIRNRIRIELDGKLCVIFVCKEVL